MIQRILARQERQKHGANVESKQWNWEILIRVENKVFNGLMHSQRR